MTDTFPVSKRRAIIVAMQYCGTSKLFASLAGRARSPNRSIHPHSKGSNCQLGTPEPATVV